MNKGEIIIYQTSDGKTKLDVKLENETIWMSQKQIAELFDTKRPAITKHLGNIFKDGELQEDSVSSILEHTALDGKVYDTKFYNLDAILSVGYRVNSKNATQFRIWANNILKEYIIKGVVINQQAKANQLQEAFDSLKTLTNIATRPTLDNDQARDILHVICMSSN